VARIVMMRCADATSDTLRVFYEPTLIKFAAICARRKPPNHAAVQIASVCSELTRRARRFIYMLYIFRFYQALLFIFRAAARYHVADAIQI
jgi:hypothetical protein